MGLLLILALGFAPSTFAAGCGDLIASTAVQDMNETLRRARYIEDRWVAFIGYDSALSLTALKFLVAVVTRPGGRIAEAELIRDSKDFYQVSWESLRRSIGLLRHLDLLERIKGGGSIGPSYGLTKHGEDTFREFVNGITEDSK